MENIFGSVGIGIGIGNPFSVINTSNIAAIKITDIIDILLVAVIIYWVIVWIRETRAWFLLRGILVLGIVSLLSNLLNLYTVSWIIEKTLSVGIIAIIILFQPEFRKALENIGKGWLVSSIFSAEKDANKLDDSTVKEIVDAAVRMAREKTGALIVIEKSVPVDLKNPGIHIDAAVSSQLLTNIFVNKTPLHDGAVIIKNNRIASAACILPLTEANLNSDLGTRHRAAVGASEVSDAYIVVVSEETGKISVAHEGSLRRGLSAAKLTEILSPSQKTSYLAFSTLWKGLHNNENKKDN
ncbi:MAG: diadenylate cyclase CdaA [Clostridiales bacterium]|nr:diadenylate cyclase CdaA [Clostridiales bacterium]